MARLGTAFVSIEPDFSSFDRLVARKLAGSFRGAGERAGSDFSDGFDRRSSGLLAPIGSALDDVTRSAERVTEGFKDADRAIVGVGRDGSASMKATQVAAGAASEAVASVADKVGSIPQAKLPTSAIGALDQTGRIDLQIAGAEAELATLQAQIDALTAQPTDVEVDAKIGKAVAKFNAIEAQRDKLVSQRNDITVQVDRTVLARLQQDFSDLTLGARVDIQMEAADQELSRLQARLNELAGKPATVKVNAEIAEATTDLLRVQAQKDRLSATRAKIDVDVDRGLAERFNEITTAAGGLVGAIGTAGGGLGGATTRISAGFFSFGASLTPLVAIIATLAIAIGVSLVGALAALGSSLAFAAAGVGGLAAAIGGVLTPAIGLAVAVGSRLGNVFEALKAQDAAADQVGRATAAGSAAAAAAVAAQESAARALTDANRQLGEATDAAYREMADAAEAASDAIRGVANAQLSLEQAELSTEQAQLALEKFRAELGATGSAFGDVFQKFTNVAVDTSGLRQAIADANDVAGGDLDQSQLLELRQKILDVRAAKLREKDAVDGVSDAMRASTRAQQIDNQFKRQGIAASKGYQAALRGVETATLAVAAAQKQDDLSAAQIKAADLTADLTDKERELLAAIKEVRTELRGAFQPATDAVFGGLIKALDRVPNLVNPLRGSFKRLGEAWADATDRFSADLIRPDSISKLKVFTAGAAELAGPITDGISALLDILTDIGRAALPYLVSGTKQVAEQLKEWAGATGNTKELNEGMETLMDHLKTWLGVAGSIANVFLAFLPTAAADGKNLAESIKGVADRTAVWLRSDEGRKEMGQFFKDTIEFAKQFIVFLGRLIQFTVAFGQKASVVFAKVVDGLGGSKAAADTLVAVIGTLVALKFARGLINGARDAKRAFDVTKKAATLMHASFVTGNAVTRTATKVQKAFTAVLNGSALAAARHRAAIIGSRIAMIASTAASKALAAAQWLINVAMTANPIGLIIAALVALGAGLVIAYKKSETFRNIVNGVFAAVKKVAVEAIQFIIGAIDKWLGAYSSMLTALSKVPGFGWAKKGAEAIDGVREKVRGLADSLADLPTITKLKVIVDAKLSPSMKKLLDNIDSEGESRIRRRPPVPGLQRHFGGMIPGSGNTDSVNLWATPGEHVTRKAIVKKYGPTVFADINEGRLDPTVGYAAGERPSVSTRPVRGKKFAEGGLVGARDDAPQVTNNFPINVVGGGPPDPIDLAAKAYRAVETRAGGGVRQGVD